MGSSGSVYTGGRVRGALRRPKGAPRLRYPGPGTVGGGAAESIVLNASAMFNHGNIRLPSRLDRVLRWAVVTPDMHRVHHSVAPHEANRNFGFNLPWWDRLFGTYQGQPAAGHEAMVLGIDQFRTARDLWPDRMLIQPFLGETGDYPGNRG